VGLLGRNGAGKTTTFKMILGLLKPTKGKVFFDGRDISSMQIYKRARLGIGYLAQEPSIFVNLTVRENLLAIMEFVEKEPTKRMTKLEQLINDYGLQNVVSQKAHTLSGGEARRLEIARTMCTNPRLFLLDEPFSGIDPISIQELQTIILKLKQDGIGILLTDHNVRDTLSITDKAYIIDEGKVIAEGSSKQVMQNPIVIEKYLGKKFQL
jgi:lipopolysaccharide export system ATP-binding protein